MSKRNKKKLKQRKKRQLIKAMKQVTKVVPVIVEDTYFPPYKEPVIKAKPKKINHMLYQTALDKKYNGSVIAKERFINERAVLIHHCNDCDKTFYAKPLWLLTRNNQEHICGVDTTKITNIKAGEIKPRKKVTEDDIKTMCSLAKQGMSMTKIGKVIGVSRSTVINYLRKAGVR